MSAGKVAGRALERHSQTKRGMQLVAAMCVEMESAASEEWAVADQCQLEAKYGPDMPFRNIVLERLQLARSLGPDVEAGLCAMLSHIVALSISGFRLSADDVLQKANTVECERRAAA